MISFITNITEYLSASMKVKNMGTNPGSGNTFSYLNLYYEIRCL
jgi:hypothetical protein